MSELAIQRTPELIAAEINNIKDKTRHMVLYNSIEIGRRLIEAKSLIKHGEWGNWLEKSVDYSTSTANNLMKIFNEYGSDQITLLEDNSKSQAFGNLSYTQAIALFGIPSDERENFVKENDLESMSTRELQKAIKERDEALKQVEESKKLVSQKEEEAKKNIVEVEKLKRSLDEEKENFKKQDEKIKKLKEKMEKAKNTGDDKGVEELRKLLKKAEEDMNKLTEKNKELEEQLKDKPIDVTETVIEKVPEEIQKELEELRAKRNKSISDEKTLKFKVQFDELSSKFRNLLITLTEIEEPELKGKLKNAVNILITEMAKKL